MSDADALDFVGIFFDICEIGNYKVDTGHIFVGEGKTAVNENHIVLVFKNCYIFTYLIETAKK